MKKIKKVLCIGLAATQLLMPISVFANEEIDCEESAVKINEDIDNVYINELDFIYTDEEYDEEISTRMVSPAMIDLIYKAINYFGDKLQYFIANYTGAPFWGMPMSEKVRIIKENWSDFCRWAEDNNYIVVHDR